MQQAARGKDDLPDSMHIQVATPHQRVGYCPDVRCVAGDLLISYILARMRTGVQLRTRPLRLSRAYLQGHRDNVVNVICAMDGPHVCVKNRASTIGYIGSGHVEKANNLIVARRQKNRGMQWSAATSDGLAALRTLMLNGGWERYWQRCEVLSLVAA